VRLALVVTFAACSSGKPKQVEDARRAPHESAPIDATPTTSGAAADADSTMRVKQTTGDVQIRVEWPTMPLAARVSPGSSACGALAAQVAPTTTWGIPDVGVFVEGAPPASNAATSVASAPAASSSNAPGGSSSNARGGSSTSTDGSVRVLVDRCAVSPRIAVGSRIAIASTADQPLKTSLAKRFVVSGPARTIKADKGGATAIALPIAGHEVISELAADSIYRLAPEGKDVDDGWIVGATAFVTDATGVALIKDVPPGKHAVRVWLPPRGGQPAREAKGEVTVEVGDLADLTLTLE
jgi:hypothetical protein